MGWGERKEDIIKDFLTNAKAKWKIKVSLYKNTKAIDMLPSVWRGHCSIYFWICLAVTAPTILFSCPGLTWTWNPLFNLCSILSETVIGGERDRGAVGVTGIMCKVQGGPDQAWESAKNSGEAEQTSSGDQVLWEGRAEGQMWPKRMTNGRMGKSWWTACVIGWGERWYLRWLGEVGWWGGAGFIYLRTLL